MIRSRLALSTFLAFTIVFANLVCACESVSPSMGSDSNQHAHHQMEMASEVSMALCAHTDCQDCDSLTGLVSLDRDIKPNVSKIDFDFDEEAELGPQPDLFRFTAAFYKLEHPSLGHLRPTETPVTRRDLLLE